MRAKRGSVPEHEQHAWWRTAGRWECMNCHVTSSIRHREQCAKRREMVPGRRDER